MNAIVSLRSTDFTNAQLALIRKTVAADTNQDEFDLFVHTARHLRLDPLRRQIYAFVFSKGDADKRRMSIIVAIDGFRAIADRTGAYRPDEDEPTFEIDPARIDADTNPVGLVKATVRVWKHSHGAWHKVTASAYWDEYAPIKKSADDFEWVETGEFWPDSGKPKMKKKPLGEVRAKLDTSGNWGKMPRLMLAKVAEALALRKACASYLEFGGEGRFMTPILRHFGQTRLSKIDQVAIDACAKALYPTGKPSTLTRQVYTPLSAVLQHAAARGMCSSLTIERPSQPKGKTRWLTVSEAKRLVTACSPHLRPVVLLMLYTGARVSEALYLDWAQVNLEAGNVVYLDTKNGEDRGVPLHPALIAMLARSNRREGPVFLSHKGQPYEEKDGEGGQIKTAFRGATRRAGLGKWVETKKRDKDGKTIKRWVTDVTPHTCRHTWATWHYAAHRDIRQLMELGGWKQISMVQRYTHVNVSNHAPSIAALPALGDIWGNEEATTAVPQLNQKVG